jgi:hypothetical protein
MLHTVTSSYKELAKLAGLTGRPSSSERNKKLLLEMAEGGEPRPERTDKLGMALYRYTWKNSDAYDAEFDNKISKMAPEWFLLRPQLLEKKKVELLRMAKEGGKKPHRNTPLGRTLIRLSKRKSIGFDVQFVKKIKKLRADWVMSLAEIIDEKKRTLIAMARKGGPRPTQKNHSLGVSFSSYTLKSSKTYDPEFTKKIKRIAPHWFLSKDQITSRNKEQLILMANEGKDKPHYKTNPLGRALVRYTTKTSAYDPEFNKKIKRIAPHWFFSRSHATKQQLLRMAENGDPRPKQKVHPLASALTSYTSKSSRIIDIAFAKKIRKIRPDWFVSSSQIADKKKSLLIRMAENGEPRPKQLAHPLGSPLCYFTSKNGGSYDPEFTKKIKKLAPEWFISRTQIADKKKRQLLGMAKNGDSKPIRKRHPLGGVLALYTTKTSGTYDPAFTREIKKLAPHWFGGNKADAKKIELIPGDRKAAPSFETVIQRMTNAHRNPGNPAYKAHATRAIMKYAAARAAEIGSTPTRVAAGVRASFTKRMAKA